MNRPFLIISIIFLSGCFAHAPLKSNGIAMPEVSGSVADVSKVRSGGKLGFVPFKAGPQAEDNEELDKLSLMLIKGIREGLQAHKAAFTVTDKAEEADFILEGYIEEFSRTKFSVSGEIWGRDSGAKVLTFASSRTMKPKKSDSLDTAYRAGVAIGNFIAAQAAKE